VDPLAREIQEKINRVILELPENNQPFITRMSTAGFCIRQMDYDAKAGTKTFDIKQNLRMMMGEPIHHMWRLILQAVYGEEDYSMVEAEVVVVIDVDGEKIPVPGHLDGHIKSLNAVVEVKTVSDSTYAMVMRQGTPLAAHYEQGNIYATAVGADKILFLYINRDNGEYHIIFSPYSRELADVTVAKWVQHERNKRAGILADRPFNNPTEAPCWFCSWKDDCYKGFADQVNGGQKTVVEDEMAVQMVRTYDLTRKNRLISAKTEELVREQIAQEFIKRGIKEASVPGIGTVIVKLLKDNKPTIDLKENK
jgi:hypothetical protein